ncbi:hypothetical protein GC197_10455 [bacterium]|nr:hypothetical protein [bacterium]
MEAALVFRETATALCEAMAAKLQLPPSELVYQQQVDVGKLSEEWKFRFHGLECEFENTKTNQVLDVEVGFGNEFGVLDPYFFEKFLRSTARFDSLSKLFPNSFFDCCRALEVLEETGYLVRISIDEPIHRTGVVTRADT